MNFERPNYEKPNEGNGFDLSGDRGDLIDPYASWSDCKRMEEYVHAGNPVYLTPSLAHEIKVEENVMREVPGALEADFVMSRKRDQAREAVDKQEELDILVDYRIDQENLDSLDQMQRSALLLEVGAMKIEDIFDEHEKYSARLLAQEKIKKDFLENSETIPYYFQNLDSDKLYQVLRKLDYLDELTEEILRTGVENDDENQRINALEQIKRIVTIIKEQNPDPKSSAFFDMRLQVFADNFLKRCDRRDVQKVGRSAERVSRDEKYLLWDEERIDPFISHSWDEEYQQLEDLKEGNHPLSIDVNEESDGTPKEGVVDMEDVQIVDILSDIEDKGFRLGEFLKEEVSNFSEDDYSDFLFFLREETSEGIQKYLGINQKQLSYKELWYLFKFYKEEIVENTQDLTNFLRKYDSAGARTFLSLEQGDEKMSGKIFEIGKRYAEDGVADMIFAKYGELVDVSSKANEYVTEQLGSASPELAQKVQDHILVRGKKFLEFLGSGEDVFTKEEISAKLDNLTGSAEIFTAMLRSVDIRKNPDLMSEAKDGMFNIAKASKLTLERRSELKESYVGSISSYPEALQEMLLKDYDQYLESEDVDMHMYFHKDDIASAGGFALQEDGSKYFFGFYTNPRYEKSGIASAVMDKSVQEAAKESVVTAKCDPFISLTENYINKQGFVATEFLVYGEKPSFSISLDKTKSYGVLSEDDLIRQAVGIVDVPNSDESFVLSYTANDMEVLQQKIFSQGYVLVQLKKQGDAYYGAFHKA